MHVCSSFVPFLCMYISPCMCACPDMHVHVETEVRVECHRPLLSTWFAWSGTEQFSLLLDWLAGPASSCRHLPDAGRHVPPCLALSHGSWGGSNSDPLTCTASIYQASTIPFSSNGSAERQDWTVSLWTNTTGQGLCCPVAVGNPAEPWEYADINSWKFYIMPYMGNWNLTGSFAIQTIYQTKGKRNLFSFAHFLANLGHFNLKAVSSILWLGGWMVFPREGTQSPLCARLVLCCWDTRPDLRRGFWNVSTGVVNGCN